MSLSGNKNKAHGEGINNLPILLTLLLVIKGGLTLLVALVLAVLEVLLDILLAFLLALLVVIVALLVTLLLAELVVEDGEVPPEEEGKRVISHILISDAKNSKL